ncbi:hypothetical protein D9757_007498 [Collybiopsis confluens]|uniref:PAS domain-containing protein n=1 Tax=Collybiopsis confluens TaxID=2823264 RepID=A0A8H5HK76_9AGAR|nr:hypothetical protein D9757_007498 [Collybiopsis confluens]
MPFERYIQEDPFSSEFSDLDMLINNAERTSATTTAASSHQRQHQQHAAHAAHQVKLHIPQYMQAGAAPILAPGGGAEVLPAGLFNRVTSPANSWYVNNGITSNSCFVYPTPTHRSSPEHAETSNTESSHSSPFDYDNPSPPNILSLHISSGLINPQNRLTSRQLDAIGASAGVSLGGSSSLNAPSPLGLPVYSRSGFDLLSVLARVAARPDPKIHLGPVDLSSSFLVVDVRRFDNPIIYCSPSFCRLTGYAEHEVVGKNCRFLQSPAGHQPRGEYRQYTSNEAVSYLKKNLVADKECQTSIINYRKGGDAFINLVTVIPIKGGDIGSPQEDDKVIYHVGFQVDLTEQPNAILAKLEDGSYISNYAANNPVSIVPPIVGSGANGLGVLGGGLGAASLISAGGLLSRDRKSHSIPPPAVSKELKQLIEDPVFMRGHPITTSTNADALPPPSSAMPTSTFSSSSSSSSSSASPATPHDLVPVNPSNPAHPMPSNQAVNMLLLEYAPDFLHIVSLKGTFLYVGPSVRRVLGYEPEELVGKGLVDICHPADQTPVMRELKESSATGNGGGGGSGPTSGNNTNTSPASSNSTANANAGAKSGNVNAGSEDSVLHKPRLVDLLFRAITKSGMYVWMECRGRLHVEPGKGRKAIMLSGRVKEMGMGIKWSAVAAAGGLSAPRPRLMMFGNTMEDGTSAQSVSSTGSAEFVDSATEFWGTVTRAGTLLVVGKGVKDLLGFDETELMGRPIFEYLVDEKTKVQVAQELASMGCAMGGRDSQGSLPRKIWARMLMKGADDTLSGVPVELVLYPTAVDMRVLESRQEISPAPVIYQIKLWTDNSSSNATPISHPLGESMFQELEISRHEPWQYELQQLRIQNERLRDEIRSLEEEVGEENGKMGNTANALLPTSGIRYSGLDHHLHQVAGQGHPSFQTQPAAANPSSMMYNVLDAPSYRQLTHAQSRSQSHFHFQPQVPSSSQWMNPAASTAISMQMPYVPPPGSVSAVDISPLPVTSSFSLKRSWSSSNGSGIT